MQETCGMNGRSSERRVPHRVYRLRTPLTSGEPHAEPSARRDRLATLHLLERPERHADVAGRPELGRVDVTDHPGPVDQVGHPPRDQAERLRDAEPGPE